MSEVADLPSPVRPRPRSRAATRELWLERLARFPAAGLTVAQFCAIEAVSVPTFYFWKRRLASEAPSPHCARADLPLLPVRLPPASPAVELVLTTGAILRLPPGCDLAWVRSLVAALGDSPC